MLGVVEPGGGERADARGRAFCVRPPGDLLRVELGGQVVLRGLVIGGGRTVVRDAEVVAGLEPDVVRLARVVARRSRVRLGMRAQRHQCLVDVLRRRRALDGGPRVVLHHDDEHRLDARRRHGPVGARGGVLLGDGLRRAVDLRASVDRLQAWLDGARRVRRAARAHGRERAPRGKEEKGPGGGAGEKRHGARHLPQSTGKTFTFFRDLVRFQDA